MSKKRLQMQRCKTVVIEPQPVRDVPEGAPRNKINRYTCRVCGGSIVTIDRDYGTTPANLACRATEGCDGTMRSEMYMSDQTLKPDFEFFKPEKLPRDPGMREHIQMGGLEIRKILSP